MKTKKLLCLMPLLLIGLCAMIGCSEKHYNLTSPTNTSPVATFSVTPQDGTLETDFQVDASSCRDGEESACQLLVRWDWENDGIWDTPFSIAKSASHRYATTGAKTINLEVKDSAGMSQLSSGSVLVFRTGSLADSSSIRAIQPQGYSTR